MISVELVNTYDDFVGIEPVWEKMFVYCEFPTIFQLYSWCKVWWNIYGKDKELYILIVKKNLLPIGLAPLMISGDSKKRSVEFIGTGNADYTDFMINPEFKKEALDCIFKFLIQNKEKWKKISLTQMNERTGNINLIKDVLSKNSYFFFMKEVEWCHVFEYHDNIEEKKKIDSGLNKHRNLRNSVNFFKKNGVFTHNSIKNAEIINKKLPQLFFFHWRRWKDTYTPSKFLNHRDRKFYYELTKELSKNENISLEELNVNDETLAFVYSFLYKNTIFLYTASFNVFFRKKSPSTILYYFIKEKYIKKGYDRIDFMRGGEQYKEKLTNKSYLNYEIVVFNKILKYRIEEILHNLKNSSILKKIISNPSIRAIKLSTQAGISNYGLLNAVKLATHRMTRKVFDFKNIHVYKFEMASLDVLIFDNLLEFVELKIKEVDLVSAFYGAEMNSTRSKIIEEQFIRGNHCFALKHNDVIIMTCFVDFWPFSHYSCKNINLEKNDVVLYDICCIPEYESYEVMNFFYSSLSNNFYNEDYTFIVVCDNDNFLSNTHCLKMWKVAKTLKQIILFNKYFIYL